MAANTTSRHICRCALGMTMIYSHPMGAQHGGPASEDKTRSGLAAVFIAAGPIESTAGGFIFPDGTIQSTAASAAASCSTEIGSLSSNLGMYSNQIVDSSPPNAYTEVCVGGGSILNDIHTGGESTSGGNCLPGDIGWIIERDERLAESWEMAKMECLIDGMRLPELFEYKFSCKFAGLFQLNDMTDDWEWASNVALPFDGGSHVAIFGSGDCKHADRASAGNQNGNEGVFAYRCVR